MKSNCIGIADLLCAYADGELAEQNIRLVEDHLVICENCSAILKTYKEISGAVNDTNVPAPDALRIGVMNRIKSESTPRKTDNNKLRRNYRMILTRFVPVAACLVITLFVWQFWGDLFGVQHDHASPAGTSMPGGGAPAPAADPEAAMDAKDDYAFSAMADDTDAAFESPEDDTVRRIQNESSLTTEEFEQFMEHFSGAYAEVAITGELPVLLVGVDPLPVGSLFGWEMVFEISVTEVQSLINELHGRDNVAIVYNDENTNSNYVIVLYSSNG